MRYLGIDYGSKKIGLALSDEAGTMGFPRRIITNTPRLVDELKALIEKEKVGAVVIGDSRTLAGDKNKISADISVLFAELAKAGMPVHLESEVFTTQEARRIPEAPYDVDASAAALILTSYLAKQKQT